MYPLSLYLILCFALTLTIRATPTKPGSVRGSDDTRVRCAVVAFEPDGQVWMVASKTSGWVLPKGGFDSTEDGDMVSCIRREAMEEAGLELHSIHRLKLDEGTLHWFTAKVTRSGPRTDKTLDEEKRALPEKVEVKKALVRLSDYPKKKATMHRALNAAIVYWESVRRKESQLNGGSLTNGGSFTNGESFTNGGSLTNGGPLTNWDCEYAT